MNAQHFRAFLWLRWRLRINQLKRGGIANFVILTILGIAAVLIAAGLFAGFLGVGIYQLGDAPPTVLMYVLDGAVLAFLFLWLTGLLTELQRSEVLALEKLLHLPVSLSSAFLINYFSSLPSVSLLWFLSAMLGLNIGLVISRGAAMLLLLPMLAAFLLMVTALTYQFQGWLATLMTNPRRRRTVIVTFSIIFILLCQLPSLINMWRFRAGAMNQALPILLGREHEELIRELNEGKISKEELPKRLAELAKNKGDRKGAFPDGTARDHEEVPEQVGGTIRLMNLILPPGWLAAGMEGAAESRFLPILLAIIGPSLIGAASLWRAYRTTMRLYTGQYTSGKAHAVAIAPVAPKERVKVTGGNRLLEKQLPWISEQASAIALASFRSLLRAPEAKMFLLTPLLMLVVMAPAFLAGGGRGDVSEALLPLFSFGAMTLILFGMSQLLGNQFGFDRDGFRVFVLSPASRRDILLGKNLAVAPLALTLGTIAAIVVLVVYPMGLNHTLALVPRYVSMYLLYCLPANLMSIFAPMRVAAGSFQPARPRGIVILSQLLFMFGCPPFLALTLLPVGIEWAAEALGWRYGMPLDLILSLLGCAIVVCIYGLALRWQGDCLQAREQRILQIVTTRAT